MYANDELDNNLDNLQALCLECYTKQLRHARFDKRVIKHPPKQVDEFEDDDDDWVCPHAPPTTTPTSSAILAQFAYKKPVAQHSAHPSTSSSSSANVTISPYFATQPKTGV